jgi:microcystin-dependent protein
MRGRVTLGVGSGIGLTPVTLGENKGNESTTLLETNLPSHTHTATTIIEVNNTTSGSSEPNGNYLAVNDSGASYDASGDGSTLNGASTVISGALDGTAFSNIQPSIGLNHIIKY